MAKLALMLVALATAACTSNPVKERKRAPTQAEFEQIMLEVRARKEHES